MTLSEYANQRPDLQSNWQIARNQGHNGDPVVEYILGFDTFEDYVRADYGSDFDPEQPEQPGPVASPPAAAVRGYAAHIYVGRDAQGDAWQLFDLANGNVWEWRSPAGMDSRTVIPGTMRDIGPPSPYSVAQAPAGWVRPGSTVTPPPVAPSVIPPAVTPVTPPPTTAMNTRRILHPISGWPIDIPLDAQGRDLWTAAGVDGAGNPIFQLIDSGGQVKQWTIDQRGMLANLVNATTPGVIVPTIPPATPPPVTTPPVNAPPGTQIPQPQPTAASSNTGLIVIAAAVLGWMLYNR